MKVVFRIALEHMRHGGVDNGRLPVTYNDLVRSGVRRNSIREAIQVAINLGWIDRVSVGEVPWHGDIRAPSRFGLTWLPRHDGTSPSNRWTRLTTDTDAKAAVTNAENLCSKIRTLPKFFNRQKNRPPVTRPLLVR